MTINGSTNVSTPDPYIQSLSPVDRLKKILLDAGDVLVVFSGGVDSALLLKVAVDTLGDKVVALTADSPTFPPEEKAAAVTFTKELGVRHLIVDALELERDGYRANAGDRCYHCKTELFELATLWADRVGFSWVMDGTIVDDLGDDRPGLKAAEEHRVRHPLLEAGFTKIDVRRSAQELGLSVWNKPAFACIGSRFPVGTEVTLERVKRVQRVESILRIYGFTTFRVRFHKIGEQDMARIELGVHVLAEVFREGIREAIVESCKEQGFAWVTLDLAGYKMGGAGVSA